MQPTDDSALLREYAEKQFRGSICRAGDAARQSGLFRRVAPSRQSASAEEITQAVFIILAKKAASMRHDRALSGWLFQAARLTADNFVRSEITPRQARTGGLHAIRFRTKPNRKSGRKSRRCWTTRWRGLGEKDRNALVLRFFEGKSFREVGTGVWRERRRGQKTRQPRAGKIAESFFPNAA